MSYHHQNSRSNNSHHQDRYQPYRRSPNFQDRGRVGGPHNNNRQQHQPSPIHHSSSAPDFRYLPYPPDRSSSPSHPRHIRYDGPGGSPLHRHAVDNSRGRNSSPQHFQHCDRLQAPNHSYGRRESDRFSDRSRSRSSTSSFDYDPRRESDPGPGPSSSRNHISPRIASSSSNSQQFPPSDDLQARTLRVTNFHERVTKELLKELFIQAGPVRNIVLRPDHAFIEFEDAESVAYALAAMYRIQLFGVELKLEPKVQSDYYYHHLKTIMMYEQNPEAFGVTFD